jgi:hypothetical protein
MCFLSSTRQKDVLFIGHTAIPRFAMLFLHTTKRRSFKKMQLNLSNILHPKCKIIKGHALPCVKKAHDKTILYSVLAHDKVIKKFLSPSPRNLFYSSHMAYGTPFLKVNMFSHLFGIFK